MSDMNFNYHIWKYNFILIFDKGYDMHLTIVSHYAYCNAYRIQNIPISHVLEKIVSNFLFLLLLLTGIVKIGDGGSEYICCWWCRPAFIFNFSSSTSMPFTPYSSNCFLCHVISLWSFRRKMHRYQIYFNIVKYIVGIFDFPSTKFLLWFHAVWSFHTFLE